MLLFIRMIIWGNDYNISLIFNRTILLYAKVKELIFENITTMINTSAVISL